MEPSEVYQEYLALKSHFDGKFDYKRYSGKIRISTKATSFIRDKLFYQKVGKHKDPKRFLLANVLANKKVFIRDLAYSKDAEKTYMEFVARQESLTYLFKQDIKKLPGDLRSNLYSISHPSLVVMYLANEIMLETLCILVKESRILSHWEKAYPYDPVMEEVCNLVKRYEPFMKYDYIKFRNIIADYFRN